MIHTFTGFSKDRDALDIPFILADGDEMGSFLINFIGTLPILFSPSDASLLLLLILLKCFTAFTGVRGVTGNCAKK